MLSHSVLNADANNKLHIQVLYTVSHTFTSLKTFKKNNNNNNTARGLTQKSIIALYIQMKEFCTRDTRNKNREQDK